MQTLVVVNDPKDWPLEIEGIELVAARTYLTDPSYAKLRKAMVFNLCRYYRYQSTGYYVSLLASARGHKPLPDITTIQDLKSQTIIRIASDELDEHIQKSLSHIRSREFVLSIYFGHNVAKQHDKLSQHLFHQFQSPFLRAYFVHNEKHQKWFLQNINPIPAGEIPPEHRPFVVEVARDYFMGRRRIVKRRSHSRYDLAILHNPHDPEPPSDNRALHHFANAADSLGINTEMIIRDDYGRLPEFDALFIRETTSVNHHTYRFARRAAAKKLVVIDDPESILKCTNKVFLAEILERNRVLTPKTVIVHKDNAAEVAGQLGFPCILKQPDSSFSQGVMKVESSDELRHQVTKLLDKSDLVIAQEFLPTEYDWRVGIFDRQPLYVCKYFMAKKHWQIIKRDADGMKTDDGNYSTLPVEHAPDQLIRTALKAANLIGDGLYGVDIKQIGKKFYVIEINDNPNIDAGVEDSVLKEELYLRVMRVFLRRIEHKNEWGQSW
ncbi:MAG: glutathione synthase [Desulfobulbaceae bacterium DB1]|nr:MAG: glutathione synthase [Desulfobulbaceae bacterium DB1]